MSPAAARLQIAQPHEEGCQTWWGAKDAAVLCRPRVIFTAEAQAPALEQRCTVIKACARLLIIWSFFHCQPNPARNGNCTIKGPLLPDATLTSLPPLLGLQVPPLRARPSDITATAAFLLRRLARARGLANLVLTPEAEKRLQVRPGPLAWGGAGLGWGNRSRLAPFAASSRDAGTGRTSSASHRHVSDPCMAAVQSYAFPHNMRELESLLERAAAQVGSWHACFHGL